MREERGEMMCSQLGRVEPEGDERVASGVVAPERVLQRGVRPGEQCGGRLVPSDPEHCSDREHVARSA